MSIGPDTSNSLTAHPPQRGVSKWVWLHHEPKFELNLEVGRPCDRSLIKACFFVNKVSQPRERNGIMYM